MATFLATAGRFGANPEPSVSAASSLVASAHSKFGLSLLNRVASDVNSSGSLESSGLGLRGINTLPDCTTAWRTWNGGRGSSMKIVARAGGYRPPSGARKPRSNYNRQQQGEDDGSRDRLPVNEEISATTVMLLGEDGKLVGTMPRQEALYRAREQELDLVQLDKQDPPCVKIVQYSKLKYELQKRKKEQQKKSSANKMDLKELKMRCSEWSCTYIQMPKVPAQLEVLNFGACGLPLWEVVYVVSVFVIEKVSCFPSTPVLHVMNVTASDCAETALIDIFSPLYHLCIWKLVDDCISLKRVCYSRYNIDVHDYAVRLRSAQRFLKDGDKVKLIIQFKGRELEFKDLGHKLFERFEEDLKEEAIVESKLTKDARSMTMVLTPNKGKTSGQAQLTPKSLDESNVEAVAAATVES